MYFLMELKISEILSEWSYSDMNDIKSKNIIDIIAKNFENFRYLKLKVYPSKHTLEYIDSEHVNLLNGKCHMKSLLISEYYFQRFNTK